MSGAYSFKNIYSVYSLAWFDFYALDRVLCRGPNKSNTVELQQQPLLLSIVGPSVLYDFANSVLLFQMSPNLGRS